MITIIYIDEYWPVYEIREEQEGSGCTRGDQVEIPDELRERYFKVKADFDAVQLELQKLMPR